MALAKQRKMNPVLAEQVIAAVDLGGLGTRRHCRPRLHQLRISAETFAARAKAQLADARLGVPQVEGPRRLSSISPRRTWPSRCTSATSARPSSAMRWHGSPDSSAIG